MRRFSFLVAFAAAVFSWGCGADGGGSEPGDTAFPSRVADLAADSVTASSVTLVWTAPGDDGTNGTASSYDLRYSTTTLTSANFGAATQATGLASPLEAGARQSAIVTGLSPATTYSFAIRTSDDSGNQSDISNVVSIPTAPAPSPYAADDYAAIADLIGSVLAAIAPAIEGVGTFFGRREEFTPLRTCPEVGVESIRDSVALTLDYGSGCTTSSGREYAGIIRVGGRITPASGAAIDLAFEDFLSNGGAYRVEGLDRATGRPESTELDLSNTVSTDTSSVAILLALHAFLTPGGGNYEAGSCTLWGDGDLQVAEGAAVLISIPEIDPLDWPGTCDMPIAGLLQLALSPSALEILAIPNPTGQDLTVELDFAAPTPESPTCDRSVSISIGGYSQVVDF